MNCKPSFKILLDIFFFSFVGLSLVFTYVKAAFPYAPTGQMMYKLVSDTRIPTDSAPCILEFQTIYPPSYTTNSACMVKCTKNDRCYMACHSETYCVLFASLASPYYNSSELWMVGRKVFKISGKCYTSFFETSDLRPKIMATYTNEVEDLRALTNDPGDYYHANLSIVGFYCPLANAAPCFKTKQIGLGFPAPKYMTIDFGVSTRIDAVRITGRHNAPNGDFLGTRYTNFEVRVGDHFIHIADTAATWLQVRQNRIFDIYSGPSKPAETIEFRRLRPLYGRYVDLVVDEVELIICDLKILGQQATYN